IPPILDSNLKTNGFALCTRRFSNGIKGFQKLAAQVGLEPASRLGSNLPLVPTRNTKHPDERGHWLRHRGRTPSGSQPMPAGPAAVSSPDRTERGKPITKAWGDTSPAFRALPAGRAAQRLRCPS